MSREESMDVRSAQPGDLDGLLDLLDELDTFYDSPTSDARQQRAAQITAALFAADPPARALVAEDGGRLVAMASYSFLWPAAGATTSLWCKELFVSASHRRRGLGRQLLRALSRIASDRSCSRVEWTTERGNSEAIAFYDALGAPAQTDKVMFRLEGDHLASSASANTGHD